MLDARELGKLEALFHALIDIPSGSEREAAALRLSGDDAELARSALELVDSDEKATAANDAAQSAASEPRTYGNYRTVRLLGSGGMGAVYLAERADGHFEQTVAVKVIAPYVAGKAFRERFLAERQILAGLSHPNIARLLDGGVTPGGMPYLVLEYIDGQPLDQYCDSGKMNIHARLELFRKLCEPIAYAHRNLVVHRDLKPSNILVTADGRPVLLDFGTAKLLTGNGTGADAATAAPLLTPRYSSPEQRSRAPITTSTDIYSLGVILYELLTGAWPFGDPNSREQMARETPITAPATAVTDDAAYARGTNLRALKSALAGDLSSILRKALAPAADERYESVQAFSADVGNYLEGRPVTAKPVTFAYQANKFVRRNFVAVGFTAFAAIALLAATGVAIYQARLARDRYTDLRSLTASLLFELKDAINDVPGSTPAQQILVSRVLKNLDKLARSSQDPGLQVELGEAYRQLGELQGSPYSQNLGDSKGALESLAKARSIAEAGLAQYPNDPVWQHLAGFSEATTAEVAFRIESDRRGHCPRYQGHRLLRVHGPPNQESGMVGGRRGGLWGAWGHAGTEWNRGPGRSGPCRYPLPARYRAGSSYA